MHRLNTDLGLETDLSIVFDCDCATAVFMYDMAIVYETFGLIK